MTASERDDFTTFNSVLLGEIVVTTVFESICARIFVSKNHRWLLLVDRTITFPSFRAYFSPFFSSLAMIVPNCWRNVRNRHNHRSVSLSRSSVPPHECQSREPGGGTRVSTLLAHLPGGYARRYTSSFFIRIVIVSHHPSRSTAGRCRKNSCTTRLLSRVFDDE